MTTSRKLSGLSIPNLVLQLSLTCIILSSERVLVEWPLDGNLLFQAGRAFLLVAYVLSL